MNKHLIIGFVGLIGIISFIIFLFWFFTPEVLLAFIAGATPSVILLYLQNRKEEKEHHNWLLRNKEACLAEIVDIFISSLHDTKGREEEKAKRVIQRIKSLQPALFVWGSPSIICAWNEMQEKFSAGGSIENATRTGERFFRAIRKELGHDDTSLKPGELWATLLKPGEKQKALDACKGEIYE